LVLDELNQATIKSRAISIERLLAIAAPQSDRLVSVARTQRRRQRPTAVRAARSHRQDDSSAGE